MRDQLEQNNEYLKQNKDLFSEYGYISRPLYLLMPENVTQS